jgi:hypothetical protein
VVSRTGSKDVIGRGRHPAQSASSKSLLPISAMARSILRLHPASTHHRPASKSRKTPQPINAMPAHQARCAHAPADDAAGAIHDWLEEFRQGHAARNGGPIEPETKSRRQDCSRLRRFVPDRRLCLSVSQHPRTAVHLGGRLHDRAVSAGNLGLRPGVTVRAARAADVRSMGTALVALIGRAILRAHRAQMDHRENLWR